MQSHRSKTVRRAVAVAGLGLGAAGLASLFAMPLEARTASTKTASYDYTCWQEGIKVTELTDQTTSQSALELNLSRAAVLPSNKDGEQRYLAGLGTAFCVITVHS